MNLMYEDKLAVTMTLLALAALALDSTQKEKKRL